MQQLYLETTIPSYLTARPTRDPILVARQKITELWWNIRRNSFKCVISQLVLDEASRGDPRAVERRLQVLRPCPLLSIDNRAIELAESLLNQGPLPPRAADDAAHIAICAVHGISYLLTWNFRHIANAQIRNKLRQQCEAKGYSFPVICTPDELMEGNP